VIKLRDLPVRRAAVAAVSVLALGGLLSGGVATASGPDRPRAVPAPPAAPTSADQIQNIDQVRTAIKAYYGDTLVGTDHQPSPTGAWAHEVAGVERQARFYLAARSSARHHGRQAIVVDVDDTSLVTYNYEIAVNFAFTPASNAEFVNAQRFPAVPGMPALVNWAHAHGIAVFFLTGRNHTQRDATAGNLAKVGYTVPVDEAHLYLKYVATDASFPAYLPCAPTCTTTQYKSLTRQHIESLGYRIVGNFGDQFSDLNGGFADRGFKLPNPMYFLP
jgi:HAD superfamily, subfamily IIIB (Acid phosphatase)